MLLRSYVTGPIETNTYLVGDEETGEAILIDPGGERPEILDLLGEKGLRLTAIVNTHGHFDHVAGNRVFMEATGAPLLIHEADAALLATAAAQADLFMLRAENSPPADRFLREGEVVRAGGVSLTVVHTPGHSPGSVTLVGDGKVFCGDLVFYGSVGRTDLPGGSTKELQRSIKKHIIPLPDATIIYSGHGPETTVGNEKEINPFF